MAKANLGDMVGGWAFLIGVILAVIAGVFPTIGASSSVLLTFVIIGIIIGLLNIGVKESTQFLFSGLVLVLISSAGVTAMADVPYVNSILAALMAIFIPATVIVAVKNVLKLAKR